MPHESLANLRETPKMAVEGNPGEASGGLGLIRVVYCPADGISNQKAVLALIEAGADFLILWWSRWCGRHH